MYVAVAMTKKGNYNKFSVFNVPTNQPARKMNLWSCIRRCCLNDNKNACCCCNLQMAHVFNSFSNKNKCFCTINLINIYFGTLNYTLSGINLCKSKTQKIQFY